MKRLPAPILVALSLALPASMAAAQPAPPSDFQSGPAVPALFFTTFSVSWTTPMADPVAGLPIEYKIWRALVHPGDNLPGWMATPTTFTTMGAAVPGSPQTLVLPFAGIQLVAYFAMRLTYADGSLSMVVIANEIPVLPDPGPPNATTIAAGGSDHESVTITFTAPGEDPPLASGALSGGPVVDYDIRFTEAGPILTDAAFAAASLAAGAVFPGPPGTAQTIRITDLMPDRDYHVAMKALDDQPANYASVLSNSVSIRTAVAPPPGLADSKKNDGCAAMSGAGGWTTCLAGGLLLMSRFRR